ncbi:MAG: hypothetical protein U0931_18195 [Vulcanimicrobiota bacterium]
MIYLPIARYWERLEDGLASAAERQAAELACRRLAALGLNIDPEQPGPLPEPPEPPSDLLEGVIAVLQSEFPAWVGLFFGDLVAFQRAYLAELNSFRALYPACRQPLAAAEQDLGLYQEAVGAMAQGDWAEAGSLFAPVARRLAAHRQSMSQLRAEHGCCPEPALDDLAWSCQRGRPDASALAALLSQLGSEVKTVLEQHFPDPRLGEEWQHLWGPRLQALQSGLAQADLSTVPEARQCLNGLRHWLRRARQRRDFAGLPWWRDLRQGLCGWFAGWRPRRQVRELLRQASAWLSLDLSGWPERDRQFRQHHVNQAGQLLEEIEGCLSAGKRPLLAELVARADRSYDRWLWLNSGAPEKA